MVFVLPLIRRVLVMINSRNKLWLTQVMVLVGGIGPLLIITLTGCVTGSVARVAISVKKQAPFTIMSTDEEAGWGQLNHPFLRQVSSNRLALTYWVAGDGKRKVPSVVDWPLYSDDNGLTWQSGDPFSWFPEIAPTEIQLHIRKGELVNPNFDKGLFFGGAVLPDGRRLFFQRKFNHTGRFTGYGVEQKRDDERYSLFEATYNWDNYPDHLDLPRSVCLESPAAVISNGTIYTVGYGGDHGKEGYRTYLFRSTDAGRNFQFVSIVASKKDAPWGKLGPCEPAVLHLGQDELLVVMRTDGIGMSPLGALAPMLMARSMDGGETWERSRMSVPGAMPKLLQMQNGIIVLAFGRPGNNLIFSTNGGRSWGAETIITVNKKTTGYLDLLEVEPGRLLVVHDLINEPLQDFWLWEPTRVNGLVGRYVDVDWRF
jgi:hypothetical protein